MRERMELAAESLDFERAAELRDALQHLEQMEEPTVVLEVEGGDRDVIGYARDGDDAVRRAACASAAASCSRASISSSRTSRRRPTRRCCRRISSARIAARGARARAARAVRVRRSASSSRRRSSARRSTSPQRGPRRELVDLATQNARHLLEELRLTGDEAEERAGDPVYELQRAARPAEGAARPRLLRHLARAGHRHGRVVRLVPERPAAIAPSIGSSR